MRHFQAAQVVNCQNSLGETPRWHSGEQALYWIDIRATTINRLNPSSGSKQIWKLPDLCGGLVIARDGLVVAMRRHLARFNPHDGSLVSLVDVEPAALDNRLNEMRCDPQGRIWVGSMRDFGTATTGSVYRVDSDLTVHPVLRDICVPNCFAWSPDGRVMYLSDSPEYSVRAYDFDGDTGTLGAMRILHDDRSTPGRPDGGTVDTEGNLWVARPRGSCLARITPEGVVDQIIHVPATHPTACVFAGPDLRTLYITTARQRLTEAELAPQPMAGDLFAIELDVGGLPEPSFG